MKPITKVHVELHLTFANSLNHKHVERLKEYNENITPEEISDIMDSLCFMDLPDKNGVFQCTRPLGAKFVEVRVTELFKSPEAIMRDFLPKPPRQIKPQNVIDAMNKPKKEIPTILTLGDLLRKSPVYILKVMKHDREVNEDSSECLDRYLKNIIRSQVSSELLPRKKQIHPTLFRIPLQELYAGDDWDDVMVNHLPNLKVFFSPDTWYDLMKRYQKIGRNTTARLMSVNENFPDYSQADQVMGQMLADAKERSDKYLQKMAEMKAKYSRMKAG